MGILSQVKREKGTTTFGWRGSREGSWKGGGGRRSWTRCRRNRGSRGGPRSQSGGWAVGYGGVARGAGGVGGGREEELEGWMEKEQEE